MLDFTDSGSFLSPRSATGDSGELKAEDPNDAVGDGNAEREAPNMMGVTDEGADFAWLERGRGTWRGACLWAPDGVTDRPDVRVENDQLWVHSFNSTSKIWFACHLSAMWLCKSVTSIFVALLLHLIFNYEKFCT